MRPNICQHIMASVEEGSRGVSLWLRFIDDILVVWPGLGEGFSDFLAELNSFHPNLKYTAEESTTSINFLDLRIYKGTRFQERRVLDLGPYFKKTNRFQYLHYRSCHPRHIHKATSQQRSLTYAKSQKKIGEALLARGYPKELVARTFGTLPFGVRQEMLKPNRARKVSPEPGCAALRVPYDPTKPPSHIRRLLPQLTESQPIQSMSVFQGSKHTSQKIVRSKVRSPNNQNKHKNDPTPSNHQFGTKKSHPSSSHICRR